MVLKSLKRVPFAEGSKIKLGGSIIINDDAPENVDEGGTCLVYRGHVESGLGLLEGTPVIIKEFYPKTEYNPLDFERQKDGKLKVSQITKDSETYKEKFQQFMKGIELQKELSRSQAMEIAVKPLLEGWYGDTYYVVSDIHLGRDISKVKSTSLEERLKIAICVAESMQILHESGYVMLDFKPENLMYIESPASVRIIDTDSLWNCSNNKEYTRYINRRYLSPELLNSMRKYKEGDLSTEQLHNSEKDDITPLHDIYAMGVFFLELFMQWLPECVTRENEIVVEPLETVFKKMRENLLTEFIEKYRTENISSRRLQEVGEKLLGLIEKSTYFTRAKRRKKGYDSAQKMFKELCEIYSLLTSENLESKRKIAKANGIFTAYNMLQKYPLFHYTVREDELSVVLAGNHLMMEDMLSAVISIGQMVDKSLKIHLVGEDIERFWEDYVSENKNAALKRAIILSKNKEVIINDIDKNIVARALAEIEIYTGDTKEVLKRLASNGESAYFVLLDESSEKNEEFIKCIGENVDNRKTFVGYLQSEEEIQEKKKVTGLEIHEISAASFCSTYNEKMYEEQIFDMGLMAHAYYMGGMKKDISLNDMEILKAELKNNIYNMASSERTGLHSIYKMASLGIDTRIPGKNQKFMKKIQSDEVLEKLAWIEHLSWSGFMLTSGAVPATIEEFEEYAYKEKNDWKCRENQKHLKHPLLVSSEPYRKLSDEQWECEWDKINVDALDNLDRVSIRIFEWYNRYKADVKEKFEKYNIPAPWWVDEVCGRMDSCIIRA